MSNFEGNYSGDIGFQDEIETDETFIQNDAAETFREDENEINRHDYTPDDDGNFWLIPADAQAPQDNPLNILFWSCHPLDTADDLINGMDELGRIMERDDEHAARVALLR